MQAFFSALTGWVLFSGLIATIGAVVFRVGILPRASLDDASQVRTHGRVALVGAGLVGAGLLMAGARQLIEFRDPFVPWQEDAALLLSLEWGRTWMIAVGSSLVLFVATLLNRVGRPWAFWLVAPLAFGLAFYPGFTGHAAGVEKLRPLALLADGVHIWGAGAWIGCLAVVLIAEAGMRTRDAERSLLPHLVPAFTPVAVGGVVLLIATGAFATWLHIPDRSTLTGTTYGGTLLVKIVLVMVALALGAQNNQLAKDRLNTPSGEMELRRTALFELSVAQLILIVTAILVRTSPGAH